MYPQLKLDTPKSTKYCKVEPVPTFIKKKAKRLSRKRNSLIKVIVVVDNHRDRSIIISCTKDDTQEEYYYHFRIQEIISYSSKLGYTLKRLMYLNKHKTSNIFKVGTDVPTEIYEQDDFYKNFKPKNKIDTYKRIREKLTYDENIYDKSLTLYRITNYDKNGLYGIHIADCDIHFSCCVFIRHAGHLTFLAHDVNYALTYSKSANTYFAGCRVFTREQAIEHWRCISQYTSGAVSDERRNRAKLFLEAINNHIP